MRAQLNNNDLNKFIHAKNQFKLIFNIVRILNGYESKIQFHFNTSVQMIFEC